MSEILKAAVKGAVMTLVAAVLSAACASAATWNMPTPYPAGSFHTKNIQIFANEVREATGGALDIVVHPAGSLVKHPEIKNAVRSGQVPIGEFLLSRLSNENPLFEADAVPFLAASYDDSRRLWRAQRQPVQELLSRQRLTVLYAAPWPPQGLYASRPLVSIDDLAGMRFRTYNAATERLAQLAGAVPTQIEVPDIPQAFATGRVEGMITSSSTGVNAKAWDFLDHYYDTQAFLPKNVIVVNAKAFAALPEDHRAAVLAAAERAEARGWDMSRAEAEKQTKALADNGIAVADPSPELAASLSDIGAVMAGEWVQRAGPAGAELIRRLGELRTAAKAE